MRSLLVSVLLLPTLSFAAIQAGFPSQALWVSKSSIVEGETIVISAVVLNAGSDVLRATLVFTSDGTRIGAREFTIPGGESQIHSMDWRPKRGEYRIAAKIEGTSAPLSQKETSAILVSVAEPPVPSAMQETISQMTQTAAMIASSSAPILEQAARALFAQTEALRNVGIEHLENYLASNAIQMTSLASEAPSAAGAGAASPSRRNVKGASTNTLDDDVSGFDAPKERNIFDKIAQAAAAAALFTMKSMVLFYPLLAFLFFGLLYFLARRVRRQKE